MNDWANLKKGGGVQTAEHTYTDPYRDSRVPPTGAKPLGSTPYWG